MIEVKHLFKSFEDKDVLKDINAVFDNGKTNLIIGQSGSGKTVLMKNLVGLLHPTSGQVLYDGRDLVRMSKRERIALRREMGMIFQSAALFDSLSVLENVMFPLDMFSTMTYRDRKKRARECLDRVNLVGAEKKYPGEISGGMQKRVAIARAISLNPKYLFCDEPNSGLDPKTSLVIDDLLSSITKEYNTTTIINTHDMNSVMGIGENIIFIYEGRMDWQGKSDQVMRSTNKRRQERPGDEVDQQASHRLHLRQRPAERPAPHGHRPRQSEMMPQKPSNTNNNPHSESRNGDCPL